MKTKKNILMLLPTRSELGRSLDPAQRDYNLHLLADPHFNDYLCTDPEFDPDAYIDKAVNYIKENEIDGVFSVHCPGTAIQAIVAQRAGLPGPSLKSQFYCLNKYYGRMIQDHPEDFWFAPLDVFADIEETRKNVRDYPLYIKPCDGQHYEGQSVVRNEEELKAVLSHLRQGPLADAGRRKNTFYLKHLAPEDRPADSVEEMPFMMMEPYVDYASEHCYEGFITASGEIRYYLLSDMLIDEYGTIEAFTNPSTLDAQVKRDIQEKLDVFVRKLVDMGYTDQSFDVEFFLRKDGQIQVCEVNSRFSILDNHYQEFMGPEIDKIKQQCQISVRDEVKGIPEIAAPGKFGFDFSISCFAPGKMRELVDVDYLFGLDESLVRLKVDLDKEVQAHELGGPAKSKSLFYVGIWADDFAHGREKVRQIKKNAQLTAPNPQYKRK